MIVMIVDRQCRVDYVAYHPMILSGRVVQLIG